MSINALRQTVSHYRACFNILTASRGSSTLRPQNFYMGNGEEIRLAKSRDSLRQSVTNFHENTHALTLPTRERVNNMVFGFANISRHTALFVRTVLGYRAYVNMRKSQESAVTGNLLFGKHENFPAARGADIKYKKTGFFAKLCPTGPWEKGFFFTKFYAENFDFGIKGHLWGGSGIVNNALDPKYAKQYDSTVFGTMLSHKNSYCRADHESKTVPDRLFGRVPLASHAELHTTSVSPDQFTYIAQFEKKGGPANDCIHFERGNAPLEIGPRSDLTESFFDEILESPNLPEDQKEEVRQLRREWTEKRPEKPEPALELNEAARAETMEELEARKQLRKETHGEWH